MPSLLPVEVFAEVPIGAGLPPAEGANYFHFTMVGGEFQMLVGSIDLRAVHAAKLEGQGQLKVTPALTHRFTLSPMGFAALKNNIDEIVSALTAAHADQEGRE